MKAYLNISYATLGGFQLQTDLTDEQIESARERGVVAVSISGRVCDHACSLVTRPDEEPFVQVQAISFCGSRDLPPPSLFREHMANYRENGWELSENTTNGLFTASSRYRKALDRTKPFALSMVGLTGLMAKMTGS